MIQQTTLEFLRNLEQNNNRAWFEEHKDQYLQAKANVEEFIEHVKHGLNQKDIIDSHKLYRIYRDVRFSKDKTPYKGHLGGFFRRAGADRRGGYAFRIKPDQTQIGGGFYGPNKEDLFRIRKEFEADYDTINNILNEKVFKDTYGQLLGEGVKTAPKGFSKEHPNIALIRKKRFYAFRSFSDAEVTRKDFVDQTVASYEALRPFFDYMTEVLTTNLNGESIL